MSPASDERRFAQVLARSASHVRETGVNLAALRRDARTAVQLAVQLHDYRTYLAQARAFKSERPGSGVDAEVLVHGRQALADARGYVSSSLRVVRGLQQGGALPRIVSSWRSALQETGTVFVADEWASATASAESRQALIQAGLSPGLVDAIDEAIRRTLPEASLDGTHIVVRGTVGGASVTGRLDTAAPPTMPTNAIDLLTRGRFGRMAEMFDRGEPAYLEGIVVSDGKDRSVPNLALHSAFSTYRDILRHVRKLEDTGLATYQGASPAAILVAIALVAILGGVLLTLAYCDDPSTSSDHPVLCELGKLLVFVGGVLLLVWGPRPDQAPDPSMDPTLIMGGPLVHGVLTDLESSAASI